MEIQPQKAEENKTEENRLKNAPEVSYAQLPAYGLAVLPLPRPIFLDPSLFINILVLRFSSAKLHVEIQKPQKKHQAFS
mgnify:FL=1